MARQWVQTNLEINVHVEFFVEDDESLEEKKADIEQSVVVTMDHVETCEIQAIENDGYHAEPVEE